MQSGQLRQRITIEQPTVNRDAAGQSIRSWSTLYADVPASVVEGEGDEKLIGRQVQAVGQVEIQIRYLADVDPTMRVLFDGRTLGITRVRPADTRRRKMFLTCKENAP